MIKKSFRKGFTLIELLASIAVLAVVLLLVTVSYSKIRKNSLNKQYNNLKTLIEQVSLKYSSKTGAYNFFVQELIDEDYLEPDDEEKVYDPRNKEPLNCHLVTINDEEPVKATLHEEDHTSNDGTCDRSSVTGLSSDLLLSAVLTGTNIVYTADSTVNSNSVYPHIHNGWTRSNITITADVSRISEDLTDSRIVWNNNPDTTTYYPNVTFTSNESVIYDDFYYADLYLSNDTRYQARLKYKMDNEKPVIYHEKTKVVSSVSDNEWAKSKTVVLYVTDKDGVGLDRIYIGPRPCADLLTDGTIGQAAIPGLVQTYIYTGEAPASGEQFNVCAVDKLGNLADKGTVTIAKVDSVPPQVETKVYIYDDVVKKTDLTKYTEQPLATLVNQDVNIETIHTDTQGWTRTGHMYRFNVTDNGSGLLDNTLALWSTDSNPGGNYDVHNTYTAISAIRQTSLSTDSIRVFGAGISGKGKRIGKFYVCDLLNNCREVKIIHEWIDKDKPSVPEMNYIYGDNAGTLYPTTAPWTNKSVFAARSKTSPSPYSTDLGSGVSYYQIGPDGAESTFETYNYSVSNTLYAMETDGQYKRYFRAIDIVGNVGDVQRVYANVDKVAPAVGGLSGVMIHRDPNFTSGVNDAVKYNNQSTDAVTVTRKSETNPTGGNYILEIKTNGSASPGLGGFVQYTNSYANGEFYHIIVANIPVGYRIEHNQNATGDGRTIEWITSRDGTGDWEYYIYRHKCGSSGSFGTFGHVYLQALSGSSTTNVTWKVAYSALFDVSKYSKTIDVVSYSKDETSGITGYGFSTTETQPTMSSVSARRIYVRNETRSSSGSVYAWYKDAAGNVGHTRIGVNKADSTGPTCGTVSPAVTSSDWSNSNRTISVACSDDGSGCKQTTFSKTFSSDTETATITLEDNLGNTTNCSVGVYVDKSKPKCGSPTGQGSSSNWSNTTRTISVPCTDTGGSGCVKTPYTTTFSYEVNTDIISIYDKAGNKQDCLVDVYIDKTPPVIRIDDYKYTSSGSTHAGDLLWDNSTYSGEDNMHYYNEIANKFPYLDYFITFKVTATDNRSGVIDDDIEWERDIEYNDNDWPSSFGRTDNGTSLPYYNNFNVHGHREARVTINDKAGNTTKVNIRAIVMLPSGSSGSGGGGGTVNGCKLPKHPTLICPTCTSSCSKGYGTITDYGENKYFGCKTEQRSIVRSGNQVATIKRGRTCSMNSSGQYIVISKPSVIINADHNDGKVYYDYKVGSNTLSYCGSGSSAIPYFQDMTYESRGVRYYFDQGDNVTYQYICTKYRTGTEYAQAVHHDLGTDTNNYFFCCA